jgi:hypothetical protein
MRRPAIEALQRGVGNLAANWQLVAVQVLQILVVSLLFVAGLLPFIVVLGTGTLRAIFSGELGDSSEATRALEELTAALSSAAGSLMAATVVAAVVWTVALFVYAYFQAGVFGVLAAGEGAAALEHPRRKDFKAFSVGRFRSAADRGLWTFFWLINVFMLLGTLALAVTGGLALVGVLAFARETTSGAIAVGCLGGAFAIGSAFAFSLWWQLAMASAVVDQVGVVRAAAVGGRILLRRAGGVLVLTLLAVVVGMTAAIAFAPAGIFIELAFGDSISAYVASQVVVSVVQSIVSSVIGIVFAAALIALVRGEVSGESAVAT